ncbi:prolyl oligopeptidase family serine peptidase [Bifidobacterium sp. ESL0690]|uniref:S9 family peptidase n=1 Tax=Bifidobacterium sp. ESL0690 TaxID=2983214 RepID=UPI0023F8D1EF|nr:prolyl oligopeptidase family serine peptidase [Bifidobacterium sp. ESL0690]WEV46699.1 prolyl oligopeptidase family serine peptidase [Bifidobacterium sp. ESL0690]
MTLDKTENGDDLDSQARAISEFPGRKARTLRFTGGAPRAAQVIGDGSRALFLRSDGAEDLVTSLWMSVIDSDQVGKGDVENTLNVQKREAKGPHREVLLADPRELLADADNEDVPAEEKARRERAREGGQGIVSYSVDSAGHRVVFTINGQLFVSEIDEDGGGARTRQIAIGSQKSERIDEHVAARKNSLNNAEFDIKNDGGDEGDEDSHESRDMNDSSSGSKWLPVLNPRISPDGRHIVYTTGTRLVMVDIADWGDSGFDDAALNQDANESDFAAGNDADGGTAATRRSHKHARPHTCAAEAQGAWEAGDVNGTNASGDRFSTVWSVGNDPSGTLKIGLAEFVAGEEMDRYDGFWWAPDSRGLLFEMYDSSPEPMWYISDPANPSKPATGRRYARALTKNAIVRLMLAHLEFDEPKRGNADATGLGGGQYAAGVSDVDNGNEGNDVNDESFEVEDIGGDRDDTANSVTHYVGCDVQNVSWDREGYEYVAAVSWKAGREPLVLVQNRRQTRDQVLEVQPDGRTCVVEEHANDQWIDLVLGTPAFTPDGRLVCALNDMDTDTNRLTVDGKPFTPIDWQVRTVLDVSDENVLAVVQRTPHEVASGVDEDAFASSDDVKAAKLEAAINVIEVATAVAPESVPVSNNMDSDVSRSAMEIVSERGSLPAVPAAWRGDEGLHDARSYDVVTIDFDGNVTPVTANPGVWTASRAGNGIVISGHDMAYSGAVMVHALANKSDNERTDNVLTNDSGYVTEVAITSYAETPGFTPNTEFVWLGERRMFTAITRPSASSKFAGAAKLPVLLKPYGGPGFQQVTFSQAGYAESQWWADQGFIVVTADGRGTTGRGPKWDREIFENMKDVTLADQIEALRALPQIAPDADLDHVAMIGWSYGGFLSALAVLDAPDAIHAACAGAPPTEWTLYDTHYTERYLGLDPAVYERNSIVADAPKLRRPLMLIHGFADDNVTIANSLRLSQALMEAGCPHTYLPLTGITHMTNDPKVAENLLIFQRDFLYDALSDQV